MYAIDLVSEINPLLNDSFNPRVHVELFRSQTTCVLFDQIKGMITRGLLKRWQKNKKDWLELTNDGLKVARGLREFYGGSTAEQNLGCNKLAVIIDGREGGGAGHHRQTLVNQLKSALPADTEFVVRNLYVGDYNFCWRNHGGRETLLPCLIERKTWTDVAESLKDGRWVKQQARMKEAARSFDNDGCKLAYIIEGARSVLNARCDCGEGHVLVSNRCTEANEPTRQDCLNAVEKMQNECIFTVYFTKNYAETAALLAAMASELVQRHNSQSENAPSPTSLTPIRKQLQHDVIVIESSGESEEDDVQIIKVVTPTMKRKSVTRTHSKKGKEIITLGDDSDESFLDDEILERLQKVFVLPVFLLF